MMELKTFEVLLPAGTTNHSDPHLLCPPASWENVAIFFLGNYITHAATVKLPPSTPILANLWICIGALLMPATGLVFGLLAFSQAIKGLNESELTKATVAGALCMYVRTTEWPPAGQAMPVEATLRSYELSGPAQHFRTSLWFLQLRNLSKKCRLPALRPLMRAGAILLVYLTGRLSRGPERLFHLLRAAEHETQQLLHNNEPDNPQRDNEGIEMVQRQLASPTILLTQGTTRPYLRRVSPNANVHGLYYHHEGYELVFVPTDAVIDPIRMVEDGVLPQGWKKDVHLAKSWNVAKGLVALLQLCFSVFVLVKAQGNQIEIYGYAAFSLTVAPYAVMAAVNLLANACMPTYTCLYLVRNDVLTEIEDVFHLEFDGVVGTVRQGVYDNDNSSEMERSGDGSLHMVRREGEVHTRLEVLTPKEFIARGIIPRQEVAIKECGEIQLEARRPWLTAPLCIFGLLLVGAPVAIVGIMSKFRVGTESTPTERGVLMAWLGVGQLFGVYLAVMMISIDSMAVFRELNNTEFALSDELLEKLDIYDNRTAGVWFKTMHFLEAYNRTPMISSILKAPDIGALYIYTSYALVYGVPAIWGFIIVGQMLNDYGNCIRIY